MRCKAVLGIEPRTAEHESAEIADFSTPRRSEDGYMKIEERWIRTIDPYGTGLQPVALTTLQSPHGHVVLYGRSRRAKGSRRLGMWGVYGYCGFFLRLFLSLTRHDFSYRRTRGVGSRMVMVI